MSFCNPDSTMQNAEGRKENLEEFMVKNYHCGDAILVKLCCKNYD